jgi:hypothetical protein
LASFSCNRNSIIKRQAGCRSTAAYLFGARESGDDLGTEICFIVGVLAILHVPHLFMHQYSNQPVAMFLRSALTHGAIGRTPCFQEQQRWILERELELL